MNTLKIMKQLIISIGVVLISSQLAQAATFQIQGVKNWDTLNMRAKPGASSAIVAKIPHNGKHIRSTGQKITVGRTVWVQATWQGRQGWVSQRYIKPMQVRQTPQVNVPHPTPQANRQPVTPAPRQRAIPRTTPAVGSKGKWVLECGNMSPFWKVVVHPKALDVNLRGQPTGMIPIIYEKQDRNRWNTAMKTVLKSSNGHVKTDLTIKYTKQCFHTIAKQNVHYRVKAMIRGEELNGCCRAIRIQ